MIFFSRKSCLSSICHSLNSKAGSRQLSQESVLCVSLPRSVCHHRMLVRAGIWCPSYCELSYPFLHSYLTHSLLSSTGADFASVWGDGEIITQPFPHPFIHLFHMLFLSPGGVCCLWSRQTWTHTILVAYSKNLHKYNKYNSKWECLGGKN